MKKYEYQQFTVETKGVVASKITDTYINQLNEKGKDGWELVQALPLARSFGRSDSVTFLLKREI